MFVIKVKGLNEIQGAIQKSPANVFNELSKGIKTSVNLIRPIMRQQAPRGKTRKLSRNIFARANGLKGVVGPDLKITPYALYVHEGTRPYEIVPVRKKALWWPGALHPVRRVRHPGIKANPFVERTFNITKRPVQLIFRNTMNKIIRDFHKG